MLNSNNNVGAIFRFSTLLLFASLLLTGCVKDQLWNQPLAEEVGAIKDNACSINDAGRSVRCDRDGDIYFKTSFLEFDECGHEWDHRQLEGIKSHLRQLNQANKKVLAVVYVHGWHHNADPDDGNVANFRGLLARYVNELRVAGITDTEVLGIYVGWRGESFRFPLINIPTISGRAETADRIARAGQFKNDLLELSDLVRQGNGNNRLVLEGHSLGGRLISESFLPDLQSGTKAPLKGQVLILTVNPAIGADRFSAVFKKNPVAEARFPLWLNITSKDDWATGFVFHTAGTLGLLPITKGDKASKNAIGHYDRYRTHKLGVSYCKGADCVMPKTSPYVSSTIWSADDFHFSLYHYGDAVEGSTDHCVLLTRYGLKRMSIDKMRGTDLCKRLMEDFDTPNKYGLDENGAAIGIPLEGTFWNVETDDALIDFEKHSFFSASVHNGYVNTDLTRAVVQLIYDKDWPNAWR